VNQVEGRKVALAIAAPTCGAFLHSGRESRRRPAAVVDDQAARAPGESRDQGGGVARGFRGGIVFSINGPRPLIEVAHLGGVCNKRNCPRQMTPGLGPNSEKASDVRDTRTTPILGQPGLVEMGAQGEHRAAAG